jgi:hypothetical protein
MGIRQSRINSDITRDEHFEAAAIDTGESFWYAKLSEDIAKKAKSGLKA